MKAPTANAYCERLIGTVRRECLDYVISIDERHRAESFESRWRITTEHDLTPASAQAFQIAQRRRRLEEPIGITWLPTNG